MSFKADPAILDAFATVLEGLGGDVKAARDYLHKYLSYDYGDARMFANIANANNDTVEVNQFRSRPQTARSGSTPVQTLSRTRCEQP